MYYKILPIEEGPVEAQIWLDENPHYIGEKIFQSENYTYLLIVSDEKSTGGYQFELIEIQEFDEEILVKVRFTSPSDDQMVIQMLTHPYILIQFEKTEKKFTIELERELG